MPLCSLVHVRTQKRMRPCSRRGCVHTVEGVMAGWGVGWGYHGHAADVEQVG
jgi:hypothetical protein